MTPLILAENGSKLSKQPQPFARDKDPLYLHCLSYNFYTVHNGMAGIKVWNKRLE